LNEQHKNTRGEDTRQKLLRAALDVFGQYGFDAVTTRSLASAAGVNLQAIPYYFENKEGLYLAVAEHIRECMSAQIGPAIASIREKVSALQGKTKSTPAVGEEARALLVQLLEALATVLLSEESAAWSRFIVREQIAPTEVFERIYGGFIKPVLELISTLLSMILKVKSDSEAVRIRALSLFGQVLVFRVAHTAALRHTGWRKLGKKEFESLQEAIRQSVEELGPISAKRRSR
jgi:TetR/AcrR family transcriptional regulator, regulator of cefoperazone and chloramphenicol sensitivity